MNYAAAKIYKIESPSRPELGVYYGATTQTLAKRMASHRCNLKQGKPIRSSSIIAAGDAVISLIEQCVVTSKAELAAREAHWIKLNDCVNRAIPGQTPKEYREANRDKITAYYAANWDKKAEYRSEYNAANRERINAKQAVYNEANREQINAKQAVYNAANREQIKARRAEWRAANREQLKAKAVAYRAAKKAAI